MKLDHEITESTPLTLAAGLHERRVGDKVFVLDAQSVLHAMDNDVAVAIWEAYRGGSAAGITALHVVEAIVAGFDIDRETALGDALDCARLLHGQGILVTTD